MHIFLYKRIRLQSERYALLQRNITRIFLAKTSVQKLCDYLSNDNLILLYRNISLVLAKACYITLKQRTYLSDCNLILLQRNICIFLAKPCFSVLKQRDYLSITILFFYGEIYAQSQPRRVLLYKNRAITFRMTILFFCLEI